MDECIPARDALADAETLRRLWRQEVWPGWGAEDHVFELHLSVAIGDWVGAAHAAFLAVPGLRP